MQTDTEMNDTQTAQPERPRRTPLYALYTANAISSVGDVLTLLAIPWFVLQTTGSVAQTSITAVFTTASVAISALLGSLVVDRLGLQRASVFSDLLGGVCVALIPLLYSTVGLPFWALLALVFLAGLCTTPGGTARSVLVPDLAAMAQTSLEGASAATDGINRIARFIGAPLAGVLIALIGASNLLWIDAASFVLSAALIGWAVPAHVVAPARTASAATAQHAQSEMATGVRGYLAHLGEGVRFIGRDGLLVSLIVTVMVTNLLDAGFGAVLQPAYIKHTYGTAIVLGGVTAAFGGAAFVGTVVFGAIGHKLPRRLALGIGFTLAGATRYWILALAPVPWALFIVYALAGFCIGPVNPLIDTVLYERVPTSMRARVFGTVTAGAMVGTPLGALLSGLVATGIGLPNTLLIFGACYFLTTVGLLVNPLLQGIDSTRRKRGGTASVSQTPFSER
ncbi:MAG: MFS transporter [Ktedonobacterales bacterium]